MEVEVGKSVLKQGAVQHLYGKLGATLRGGATDAHLLAALHPTPAVCGRPREEALELLAGSEPFDRGLYAGPFGWVSQGAAEFVVAIRSALVHAPGGELAAAAGGSPSEGAGAADAELLLLLQERLGSHAAAGAGPWSAASNGSGAVAQPVEAAAPATLVSLFAGVGIVRGSVLASEWAELDLKVRQYERLLRGQPALAAAPNVNALWARLAVEELCRLGCNTFCVAPGACARMQSGRQAALVGGCSLVGGTSAAGAGAHAPSDARLAHPPTRTQARAPRR